MNAVQELEGMVRGVAERAGPAVVGVGPRPGSGSTGMVIGDGRVLTNAHNVSGREMTVGFADGRSATGHLAAADIDGDLAVLTVDTAGAPAIEWSADQPGVGTAVVALANPGGRSLRATFGLVSATEQAFSGPRGRRITGSIEHTAPLAHGSSGGPLLDAVGRLVGINTNRLRGGFYLALPADADLRARVDALGRGEAPQRRRLGLALAPRHVARRLRAAVGLPDREGLLVHGVEEDSPADRAGLRRGDLLVEAAGRPLPSSEALYAVLEGLGNEETLALTVLRGSEELAVRVSFPGTREEGSA